MNPTQKIAQLRDQVEDFGHLWRKTETRMRDAEKQISAIFIVLLLQTAMLAAVAYTCLR